MLGEGDPVSHHQPDVFAAQLERVKEAAGTMLVDDLAAELGVNPMTVYRHRLRLGLTAPHPSKALPSIEERLAHAQLLADMGESVSTIARLAHLGDPIVKRHFPEAVWTREQMNEATSLQLQFRKATFPRPRYIADEPDGIKEER